MTYREHILALLEERHEITCAQIVKILHLLGRGTSYLTGSITSLLTRMVKDKQIKIHPTKKGPRGGKIYTLYDEGTISPYCIE